MTITSPTPTTPIEDLPDLLDLAAVGAADPVTSDDGAALEVEYTSDGATMRVTTGPEDADNGARLLCAAVSHVRRRHGRRVHTVLDVGTPASWTLLEAMRSRMGTDVADVVLRRAGSSVMVTLELLPVGDRPSGARDTANPGHPAHSAVPGHPVHASAHGDRPRGREPRIPSPARSRVPRTAPR